MSLTDEQGGEDEKAVRCAPMVSPQYSVVTIFPPRATRLVSVPVGAGVQLATATILRKLPHTATFKHR